MEADSPKKLPGAPAMPRFLLCQNTAQIGEFTHGLRVEDVARNPVEGLQITQASTAFLHVRFDDERAVAITAMPDRPLCLFRSDVFGSTSVLAGRAEPAMKVGEQVRIAGQMTCIEKRRANGRVFCALGQAVFDRTRGMADLQPEVPQEVQHVLDDLE